MQTRAVRELRAPSETGVAVADMDAAGAATDEPAKKAERVPEASLRDARNIDVPMAETAGVVLVALMVYAAAVLVLRPTLARLGAAVPSCSAVAVVMVDER